MTVCAIASVIVVVIATTPRDELSPARLAALGTLGFWALADLLVGGLLVVRRWTEVFLVASFGTLALLAPVFIPLATANDCGPPGRSDCDTSAAVGWIYVGPPVYLVVLAIVVIGRGMRSALRHRRAA